MDHLGNIRGKTTPNTLLDISNRKSYNNPYLEERPNGLRLAHQPMPSISAGSVSQGRLADCTGA